MNSVPVALLREIFQSKCDEILQVTFTDGCIYQFTAFAQFEDEDKEFSPFYAQIVRVVNNSATLSKVTPGDFLYFRLNEIAEVREERSHQILFSG